jgi:phosphatidylinositol alpha-1,6-mannosyltransferase
MQHISACAQEKREPGPGMNSAPKKFILVTKRYLPARGGIEIIVRQTARFFKRFGEPHIVTLLFDDSHRISFPGMYPFAPRGIPYKDDDGTTVLPLSPSPLQRLVLLPILALNLGVIANIGRGRLRSPFNTLFGLAFQRRFRRLFRGASCIYSFEGHFQGWCARRIAREMGIPFIISPFVHPGAWGDDILNIRLYRGADMVITLSEYEKEWFRSIGVEDDRLTASGNYPFPRPGLSLHSHFGIEGPVVLYMGRREEYKGYPLLLEAWECARQGAPGAWLALIGPGFDHSIDRLNRICTGRPTDCTPDDFDIFCMPSESETFGLVYIEAWKMGKPVIARAIPAVEELMHGKEAGILLRSGDPGELAEKLLLLLSDPDTAQRMGECGRKIQSEFYSQERFESNLLRALTKAGCPL